MNYTRFKNVVVIKLNEDEMDNLLLKQTFNNVNFAVKNFEITILDMENINYLDSFAMSSLLILVNRSRERGNELKFCNVSKYIREVIKFHGFDGHLSTLSYEQYEKIKEFSIAF